MNHAPSLATFARRIGCASPQKQREASRRSQPSTAHALPSPKASAAHSKVVTPPQQKAERFFAGLTELAPGRSRICNTHPHPAGGDGHKTQIGFTTQRLMPKVEPTGMSVPRGVLKKRRESERGPPRQGQSQGSTRHCTKCSAGGACRHSHGLRSGAHCSIHCMSPRPCLEVSWKHDGLQSKTQAEKWLAGESHLQQNSAPNLSR